MGLTAAAIAEIRDRLFMQIKTPPPVPSVVKREDKMQTLRTFIQAFYLMPSAQKVHTEITLLARSAESPVARALAELGSEIVSRGITVRAIFGQLESEKTPAGWSVTGPEIAFNRNLRWAKNPRLVDAHEQLVLGPHTCWIGDSMRRDPSRRDAYEQFVNDNATTSTTISLSFERLWIASVPLLIRTPKPAPTATVAAKAADLGLAALAPRDDNGGPLASSPH
jgi:hypothetical protein